MVIQRWQTVWLLIAAILTIIFCFMPMAMVPPIGIDPLLASEHVALMPHHLIGFLVLNITVAVLLLLSIFMYKNLRRQKTVTLVSMLLLVVSMAVEVMVLYTWESAAGRVEWLGSIFLLLGALVFALMAYRGIRHDDKLLRSADRLR